MCGVNEVREYSRQKHTRSIDYTCQSGITVPVRNCLKLEEEVFCRTLVPEVSQGVGEAPLLPEDPREAQRMAAGAVAAENTKCLWLSVRSVYITPGLSCPWAVGGRESVHEQHQPASGESRIFPVMERER